MLILTRRAGETIVLNGNIRITVMSVQGSQVSIGVQAPKEISINREEIQTRIDAEKAGQ